MCDKSLIGNNTHNPYTKSLYNEESYGTNTTQTNTLEDFLNKIAKNGTVVTEGSIIQQDRVEAPIIIASDQLITNNTFSTNDLIIEDSTITSTNLEGIKIYPSPNGATYLYDRTILSGNTYLTGTFNVGNAPNYIFIADSNNNTITIGAPLSLNSIILPTGIIHSIGTGLILTNTTPSGNIELNASGSGKVIIDSLNLQNNEILSPSGMILNPGSGNVGIIQRLNFISDGSTNPNIIASGKNLDMNITNSLLFDVGYAITMQTGNKTIYLDNLTIDNNTSNVCKLTTSNDLYLESTNNDISLNTPNDILLDASGVVTVTNDMDSSGTSTGSLTVKGGVGIAKKLYVGGDQHSYGKHYILNSTESNSTLIGALVVSGGVGIGLRLNIGGTTTCNDILYASSGIPAASTLTGSIVVNGGIGISDNIIMGGQLKNTSGILSDSSITGSIVTNGGVGIGENLNVFGTSTLFDCIISSTMDSSDSATDSLIVNGGVRIKKNIYVENVINGLANVPSSSTSSGSLVVRGGVGISGDIYVGGDFNVDGSATYQSIYVSSMDSSIDTLTGALRVVGGVGIGENVHIGGFLVVKNTTNAIDASIGSVCFSGGLGIAKDMFINGKINIINTEISTSTTSGSIIVGGGMGIAKNIMIAGNCYILNTELSSSPTSGSLIIDGGVALNKIVVVYDENDASSTTTGSLQIHGGLSISKTLYVGGKQLIANTELSTNTLTGSLCIAGGIGVGGNIFIGDHTQSSGTSSGSLVVSGGIGVIGKSYMSLLIISNTTNSMSSDTGCLQVSGGCGIGKDLFVNENIYCDNGTVTCFDCTTTGTLSVDTIQKESSTSVTFSENSPVIIADITQSSGTATGALIVSGGVGVAKKIFADSMESITNIKTVTLSVTSPDDASDTLSGGVIVDGGVGVAKTLYANKVHVVSTDLVSSATTTGSLIVDGGIRCGGNIKISITTESGSYTTGALVVAGGVGIDGELHSRSVYSESFVETASDRHKKENIDYENVLGLDFINQLKPCQYNLIKNTKKNYGVIAQDVRTTLEKYNIYDDRIVSTNNGGLSVAYSNFISILIKGLQELDSKVEQLKIEINRLKKT